MFEMNTHIGMFNRNIKITEKYWIRIEESFSIEKK